MAAPVLHCIPFPLGDRRLLLSVRGITVGDSDATFTSYSDEETAGDVIVLIEELGGPAVVVGNSMGAGAAVVAAAQRPGLVPAWCWSGRSSATARPA